MSPDLQQNQSSRAKMREESDLSLEVVILIIFGIFTLFFGLLLLKIHTGELPYSPDSMYGLFLVLVSFQTITMGKTPFGDLRRSWLVIITGVCTAVIGMTACFIPGPLTEVVRILVGALLVVGGAALLLRLFVSGDKARLWMKVPGILRHLTAAAALVYVLSVITGLISLFPGITTNPQTAVFLIVFGISFFYLAWSIEVTGRQYPRVDEGQTGKGGPYRAREGMKIGFSLFRASDISLSVAILILLGVLLALLGCLLFPVNTGTLPFSPDGQLGLLLVVMAIQMMTLGETPVGQFRRSWLMFAIGTFFTLLGVFSCIVPGIITDMIRTMLGLLNIIGGVVPLVLRFLPMIRAGKADGAGPVPPLLKKLMITQTVLNFVGIAFGISMFMPGLVPAQVIAGVVVINGLLLFALAFILHRIDRISADSDPPAGNAGTGSNPV